MSTVITVGHLYPAEMNIYGDLGNIIALRKRLEWRGYEVKVAALEVDSPLRLTSIDILFGGGGQDMGQVVTGPHLLKHGAELRAAAADGLPMLVVCGLYQLFGIGFTQASGKEVEGIAVFDAHTVAGPDRMIGNLVVDSEFGRLVGFENHSGRTILNAGQKPLGRVLRGYGNGPEARDQGERYEGAVSHNAIGTYLHGSALPKNPLLADHLIAEALKRRGITEPLAPLDDSLERLAADRAAKRPQ